MSLPAEGWTNRWPPIPQLYGNMGVRGVCSVSINSFLLGALLLNIHFLGKAEVSPSA